MASSEFSLLGAVFLCLRDRSSPVRLATALMRGADAGGDILNRPPPWQEVRTVMSHKPVDMPVLMRASSLLLLST